jgi:hypothetical protein
VKEASITIPKNVLRFEVLLYLAVLVDMFSSVVVGRDLSAAEVNAVNIILIIVYAVLIGLVMLAARRRKNWARWGLVVWQVLSVLAALHAHGLREMTVELLADLCSFGLATAGLYFSFTGDAKGWFDA